MDPYSKLDHATLVRNLNAVCTGLARAMNRQRHGGPPALTYNDLADDIPLAVYCKKFVSESVKFSAGLGERKSLIDQYIELRVDAVQRLPKRKR